MPNNQDLQEYQDYKDYQEYMAYQKGQARVPAAQKPGIADITSFPGLDKKTIEEVNPQGAQAALEHFGNVASFGYLPELQAKAQPLIYKGLNAMTGQNVQPDTYEQAKQANALRLQEQQKNYPTMSSLGSGAGAAVGTGLIPELGIAKTAAQYAAPLELAGLSKTAGTLASAGRAGELAAQGGLIGGLAKPKGDDLVNLPARLQQAKTGAETGALFSLGADALIKGIKSLPNAGKDIKEKASELAFKALGGYGRDVEKAQNEGLINKIGETALKEGVIGNVPKGYQGLANEATRALESKSVEFEKQLNLIADSTQGAKIDTGAVAKQMQSNLEADVRLGGGTSSANKAMRNKIEDFIKQNPNGLSIKEAQELKVLADKQINWKRLPGTDIPEKEQYFRALRHSLNDVVEEAADKAANVLGPDSLKDWQKVKEEYGALKTASLMANKRANKEFANRFISPTDYLTAMAAHVRHGNPAVTVLAVGANHYGRKFGNQVLSKQAYNLGGLLESTQPKAGLLSETLGAITPSSAQAQILKNQVDKNAP